MYTNTHKAFSITDTMWLNISIGYYFRRWITSNLWYADQLFLEFPFLVSLEEIAFQGETMFRYDTINFDSRLNKNCVLKGPVRKTPCLIISHNIWIKSFQVFISSPLALLLKGCRVVLLQWVILRLELDAISKYYPQNYRRRFELYL